MRRSAMVFAFLVAGVGLLATREGNKLSDKQIKERQIYDRGERADFGEKRRANPLRGTIKIDLTKKPKTEDATQTSEGENEHKTTLSIYEIEGDTLKICSAEPRKDRPTEFSSKPGSGHFLRVFKREKNRQSDRAGFASVTQINHEWTQIDTNKAATIVLCPREIRPFQIFSIRVY